MHPTSWREVVNDSKHACEITAQMCCLHSAVKEGQQACVQGLSAWVTDRVRKQKRTLCKEKLSVSCVWLVKWFWWNEYKETCFFFLFVLNLLAGLLSRAHFFCCAAVERCQKPGVLCMTPGITSTLSHCRTTTCCPSFPWNTVHDTIVFGKKIKILQWVLV